VQRSLQELRLELRNVTSELTNSRGRTPTDAELAQHMDIPEESVREARQADMAFQTASLDSPLAGDDGTAGLAELLGGDDPQLEHVLDMQAVWAHWGDLAEREQQLLLMRFYGNMTQSEIGERLGVSQMHVSRLLAEALRFLRDRLVEPAASSA
jgi:RNA polymerase sigma-B factor